MESRDVMIICNQRMADELIAQDENFKYLLCICPWLDDSVDDSILAVERNFWESLIKSGTVYLREEVAGVKKHEDD